MNHKIAVREARPSDLPEVADIHIQSWRETYPGIMPQRKLDSLNPESSLRNWQYAWETGNLFLVAEVDDELCGFAVGGENRTNESSETGLGDACDGEMGALYILAAYHRIGVGRALFEAFTSHLRQLGMASMVVWVAEKNPACGFYARMGGELVDRKTLMVMDMPVPVVAYRYWL